VATWREGRQLGAVSGIPSHRAPPAEVFRFVATEHFENHPWDPAVPSITKIYSATGDP
jgi:hypothetical protein